MYAISLSLTSNSLHIRGKISTLFFIPKYDFATFSFSQQLSRYVVASGGNYSTASGISVSSTIGEPMVTTLTAGSNILTENKIIFII